MVQFNLLDNLKARVSLTALVTYHSRWLLVSPVLGLLGFGLSVLSLLITTVPERLLQVVEAFMYACLLHMSALFFPLFVSYRTAILEKIVASASLRKISDYLDHAPMGWMISRLMSLNIGLVFRAGGATVVVAVLAMYLDGLRRAYITPWSDAYDHFGSCADGIRSGLEEHIDCGGIESSCPRTCREKYGEYILIPATRDCTDVQGYVHVTTQRACSTAYNTWWYRTHNTTSPNHHAVVIEGELSNYEWQHTEDWTDGFRCGALANPNISLDGYGDFTWVNFPALFSSSIPDGSVKLSHPRAYLCYAEKSRSCQSHAGTSDQLQFEETMACPGAVRRAWFASAWRNISSPRPIAASAWQEGKSLVKFRAGRGSDGDCAEVELSVREIGSQVVFTLECNTTERVGAVNAGAEPGNLSGHRQHAIACPEDNRVRVSVTSESVTKGTLLVSPNATMTKMASYTLELRSQTILVTPDSTLILIVDKSSDPVSVSLCF